jgi:hypothetical protein
MFMIRGKNLTSCGSAGAERGFYFLAEIAVYTGGIDPEWGFAFHFEQLCFRVVVPQDFDSVLFGFPFRGGDADADPGSFLAQAGKDGTGYSVKSLHDSPHKTGRIGIAKGSSEFVNSWLHRRDDHKQKKLSSDGSAKIYADIDRGSSPAGQEALMKFIEAGNQESAEHGEGRSPAPKTPVLDRHAVQRLPPTVEETQADESVTDEVTSLAYKMMHFVPTGRAHGTEKLDPQWVKPLTGVGCRHGAGRLKRDHQYTQRRG